ncbi:hypothetical protein SAMN04488109_1851 [Chryseolinea serpens]|uniref:Uncharacterized protein n=1 Tax=Chryseolinea serpens TaxID=947013 RepID=A0A1M5MPB1_9BACT|nr:hypothetical protein [Chryseolinea serpens]SHG79086.1 hypothetical protein SAMN04488109_1851 [Chryseolinea serpens]
MAKSQKYKLAIIEEQPDWVDKFRLKLRDDFELVVFTLTPELTKEELAKQIEESEVDCIIADYDLQEAEVVQFNGDEIVAEYKKKFPFFPAFIITSKEEEDILPLIHDNEIVRLKDELVDKTVILIQRIKNKIENYYDSIKAAEELIDQLVEKKKTADLSLQEEEKLTEQYQFLEKIDSKNKELPDNLIQPASITKLDEFVENTKQIIEELSKLKK